jgi:hypothetical protein
MNFMHQRFLSGLLFAFCVSMIAGCGGGGGADETKPIPEVKAEAQEMDASQLRDIAMSYKQAIESKLADLEPIKAKLKEIPLTEMLGDEAKGIKTEIEGLMGSVDALKQRFGVYYDQLKEMKGDLSGLEK